jgi:hypothetical protein
MPQGVFELMGTSAAELASLTPAFASERYTDICSSLALRLADAASLIDQYPQLLAKQRHPWVDLQRHRLRRQASSGISNDSAATGAAGNAIVNSGISSTGMGNSLAATTNTAFAVPAASPAQGQSLQPVQNQPPALSYLPDRVLLSELLSPHTLAPKEAQQLQVLQVRCTDWHCSHLSTRLVLHSSDKTDCKLSAQGMQVPSFKMSAPAPLCEHPNKYIYIARGH